MHRKFNKNFYLLVVTLSTAFPNFLPLYADHIKENINLKENNNQILKPISIGKFPLEKSFIEFKIANTKKNINLVISNVGNNANFFKKINNEKINIEIETITKKFIDKKEQNLSIPSTGIINARLYGFNKNFNLDLTLAKEIDPKKVQIQKKGNNIEIRIAKVNIQREQLTEENIFKIDENALREITTNKSIAKAPPLGDIAIGTTLIPNPNLLNLDGPKVSLVFKQTQAKKALEFLLSKANYGFVWVQQDPSFDPDGGSGGLSAQSLNAEASSQLDPSLQGLSSSTSAASSEETNADTHRYITLTLKDVSFTNAFNAVLMASGLQAKVENGIVYVGPNVRDSVFNERISRVYRLNQTTANAAASYLANLGAKVTQTSTLSTAVTQGATQSQTVSGGASSNTTTSSTTTSVQVYGSDIGPLLGLIATTDDRLQTVTMIGSPDVITVAEGYLKQLDLRQRQVALTVRILDVQLEDGTALSNSWALRQNDNFIVNDNGTLLSAFGKYLPPTESTDFTNPTRLTDTFDSSGSPTNALTSAQSLALNPGNIYSNQNFLKFLRAQIVSANTKILANPTLILNEFPGRSGGETVAFSDISAALSSGSIGRTFGNEGFVIVGNQVPINCTSTDGDTASFEYGIAGLTFGARVLRVDDNGYVTFALSPSVSASSSIREIEGCGEIDLLSVRRLDTGSIRVKDGNTLILTGVLNATDKETITKFPFFGDIPIIGHFFRNRISGKDQRELVILVTPRILDGSDGQYVKSNNSMNISSELKP